MTSTPSDSTSMSARSAKTLLLCLLYAQLSERAKGKGSAPLDVPFDDYTLLLHNLHAIHRKLLAVFFLFVDLEISLDAKPCENCEMTKYMSSFNCTGFSEDFEEGASCDQRLTREESLLLERICQSGTSGWEDMGQRRFRNAGGNEYRPMSGISRHKDGPLYGGRVAILSLQSTCTLEFSPDKSSSRDEVTGVFLEPRSLLEYMRKSRQFKNSVYDKM
eukprot:197929-Hanusia_phi.AAC.9